MNMRSWNIVRKTYRWLAIVICSCVFTFFVVWDIMTRQYWQITTERYVMFVLLAVYSLIMAVVFFKVALSFPEEHDLFPVTLLDHLSDMISVKDIHGRYLACNIAFCEMIGRSRQELLRTDRSLVTEQEQRVIRTGKSERIEMFDTNKIFVLDILPLDDQYGHVFAVLSVRRDITQFKLEAAQHAQVAHQALDLLCDVYQTP